jgi:hypothetical protein
MSAVKAESIHRVNFCVTPLAVPLAAELPTPAVALSAELPTLAGPELLTVGADPLELGVGAAAEVAGTEG